jgi:hypothetical protein
MIPIPTISVNDDLPDGIMVGFDDYGSVAVCIEFYPDYHYIYGSLNDQEFVSEWHVCNAHARRIAVTSAWGATDYECCGNA